MNETTYKINTDIVSTTIKDKPLIYISEEAINLKRDNDNLKSIIKEVREYIEENTTHYTNYLGKEPKVVPKIELQREAYDKLLEILDKVNKEE